LCDLVLAPGETRLSSADVIDVARRIVGAELLAHREVHQRLDQSKPRLLLASSLAGQHRLKMLQGESDRACPAVRG
jgi:hypothetical protein